MAGWQNIRKTADKHSRTCSTLQPTVQMVCLVRYVRRTWEPDDIPEKIPCSITSGRGGVSVHVIPSSLHIRRYTMAEKMYGYDSLKNKSKAQLMDEIFRHVQEKQEMEDKYHMALGRARVQESLAMQRLDDANVWKAKYLKAQATVDGLLHLVRNVEQNEARWHELVDTIMPQVNKLIGKVREEEEDHD